MFEKKVRGNLLKDDTDSSKTTFSKAARVILLLSMSAFPSIPVQVLGNVLKEDTAFKYWQGFCPFTSLSKLSLPKTQGLNPFCQTVYVKIKYGHGLLGIISLLLTHNWIWSFAYSFQLEICGKEKLVHEVVNKLRCIRVTVLDQSLSHFKCDFAVT